MRLAGRENKVPVDVDAVGKGATGSLGLQGVFRPGVRHFCPSRSCKGASNMGSSAALAALAALATPSGR